jgi:RNA polymerase sigma factor (TIGR02999 family)
VAADTRRVRSFSVYVSVSFGKRSGARLHYSRMSTHSVTELLLNWSRGDQECLAQLVPLVQDELHRIASRHMRRERPGHTLQTTALVNEAYVRLVRQPRVTWQDRAHFFGIAARIMRQILVDHARSASRGKRGGGQYHLALDEIAVLTPHRPGELMALDDALSRLAIVNARKAQVVELRYFGGLNVEEAAQVLQVSPNTVIRDWSFAKAWLRQELDAGGAHAG